MTRLGNLLLKIYPCIPNNTGALRFSKQKMVVYYLGEISHFLFAYIFLQCKFAHICVFVCSFHICLPHLSTKLMMLASMLIIFGLTDKDSLFD